MHLVVGAPAGGYPFDVSGPTHQIADVGFDGDTPATSASSVNIQSAVPRVFCWSLKLSWSALPLQPPLPPLSLEPPSVPASPLPTPPAPVELAPCEHAAKTSSATNTPARTFTPLTARFRMGALRQQTWWIARQSLTTGPVSTTSRSLAVMLFTRYAGSMSAL